MSTKYLWSDIAEDTLCSGIFKLSILISEAINTWLFHLPFLPIYVQATTVQNQDCSSFTVAKILERVEIVRTISDSTAKLINIL